ncbi:DUF4128 domain-containing protein [Rahnella sp. AN3-3W3]|uniref:DUF4128 domain-containing protein n=1 Tax=Rahnella sp. AN3-3W3 TaxID=1610578 RepID=UPI000DD3FA9A|nr:DUF4128 domain-containing protein [Rahnella sp. AN3-3W3]
MSQQAITQLLETRLSEWAEAQGLQVAFDNIGFSPPDGIYLQSHVMPATTTAIDLSRQAKVIRGVYQINVIAPAGTGKSAGGLIAEQLIQLFPENQEMSDGVLTCFINSVPSAFAGISSDTSYTIPVSMSYRADIS